MQSFKKQSSTFVSLLSLFLSGVIWVLFAPTQLGGSVTYAMVDGNSMETRFHLGDLILVRTESAYGVGDAVVYKNAEIGRYVFHRIIEIKSNQFVLKGDNNAWLDSYQPAQDEIVGKLWIHIPKLGKAVEWVRLPMHMAITVALLGGVVMSGKITKKTGKQKNRPQNLFTGMNEGWLFLIGVLVLAFLGLTVWSFTRPLTRSSANISYQQEGDFYYSATGTPGVYDTELVRSGEPVFPKLTCFLNLGFTYKLASDQVQNIFGSQQIYARVLDEQSGWQRTIPLNPQTGFSGTTYFTMATLDLCQVESLVNLVEQETGLHPSVYTLEIVTDITISGEIAGSPVNDTFNPSLVFKFDKMHFYLANDDPQVNVLHVVKQGTAGSTGLQTNTFSILGLNPTVRTVRVVGLLGFGFSLMGLCLVGLNLYHTAQQSQDALIRLRYGNMLVDVYEQNLAPTLSTIDVTTIDNLAKLAERHGTMILHMALNFLHYYLVQVNGITYRYVISGSHGIEEKPVQQEAKETAEIQAGNTSIQVEPDSIKDELPKNFILEKNATTDEIFTNENKPTEADIESVWKKMQSDASKYLESHAKNNIPDASSTQSKSQEYVICTGEIEFYDNAAADAVLLRKIKI